MENVADKLEVCYIETLSRTVRGGLPTYMYMYIVNLEVHDTCYTSK